MVIVTRSTSTTDHLEQISQWEINIALLLRIEELSAFDNDKTSREVHSPSESRCSDKHLNLLLDEEVLDNFAITLFKTGMMHSDTELESMLEIVIFDVFTKQ